MDAAMRPQKSYEEFLPLTSYILHLPSCTLIWSHSCLPHFNSPFNSHFNSQFNSQFLDEKDSLESCIQIPVHALCHTGRLGSSLKLHGANHVESNIDYQLSIINYQLNCYAISST